jgi:hypothetical protein
MGQLDLGRVVGDDGAPGAPGQDGLTPYIQNGYWYIGGVNTNVQAEGTDGLDGVDGDPSTPVVANPQSGTAYTLVLTDAGKIIEANNAAAITLTIPTDASVAFPVGTVITVEQAGAGIVTVVGASGVSVNAFGGAQTAGQYAIVQLRKKAANDWRLYGGITHV